MVGLPHNSTFNGTFYMTDKGHVLVYTDGCCLNNQKREKACGGIGVYFGPEHSKNISLPLTGPRQTNNRAEILAAYFALRAIFKCGVKRAHIKTDSHFLVDCMKKYMKTWKANNWRKEDGSDVKNRRELELLDGYDKQMVVFYDYVPRDSHPWNTAADALAKNGAKMERPY